jgi:hypothetical protein
MSAEALTRWFVGGLLMAGVALAVPRAAATADDAKDIAKHGQQVQAKARELDADAARASSTPDGQRRLTERIAKQFNVQSSVVTDVRARTGSYGQATIALALSQELMKRDKTLSQQAALNTILAERQAGKGWGVIAHNFDLKLGHVISELKKADKAADHVAGKPEKEPKVAKVEKAEKPDKPEKLEKPAKPEKPGR